VDEMIFEDSLRRARDVVKGAVGEEAAEPLRYERTSGHDFLFHTAKGKYVVNLDDSGNVTRMCISDAGMAAAPASGPSTPYPRQGHSSGITEQQAIEKALAAVGGGKVVDAERKGSGYEVEISSGLGRKTKVFVHDDGTISHHKKQRFGDMLDFDF
jgi:uncharacterized membrane protein YkoI